MLIPIFYNFFYPSQKKLTPDMKLSEAFPNLQEVEIEFTEDNISEKPLHYLKRANVCNLKQLLKYSVSELLPDSNLKDDSLIVTEIINGLFSISKLFVIKSL